ncbi:heavy-metal-associated domain-containing protein [Patescibacteria group bacterium]|nr:heavy-metal-associated domain-containing protein [Patescibacteria group bacterium]
MLNLFKKKEKIGTQVFFKIEGMHCASCSMNIDGELEDTTGVLSASTSYAKAETAVTYDPQLVSIEKLKETIESLDYRVTLLKK